MQDRNVRHMTKTFRLTQVCPGPRILLSRSVQGQDAYGFHVDLIELYSRLPVTRTLYNSNLPLTQSNFHFPSDHFLYNFNLDNSNSRKRELFSISLEGSN